MSQWPHLHSCPENFEEFADIIMVVGSQRIPAHSQYLAGHSKLMQNLMRDSLPFSKVKPLVLDQQLQGFAASDLQSFLNQVYLSPVISSVAEAHALLRLADFFEAAKLMGKAVAYLEESAADDLYASDGAILTWLLLAERFNLKSLMRRSANLAAIQYTQTRKDPRFSQLGVAALKAVMDNLHILAHVYPGVVSQTPTTGKGYSYIRYEEVGNGVVVYATPTADKIAASELHVQQSYKCKACTSYKKEGNQGDGFAICPGHVGSWDWNLQNQTWQLKSNSNIVTKVLARNVLELAALLGSLPTHKEDFAGKCMTW
ncbi:hypothetical protein ABBQ32_012926 [Trebouxia sp. C0010 RCD-2024]